MHTIPASTGHTGSNNTVIGTIMLQASVTAIRSRQGDAILPAAPAMATPAAGIDELICFTPGTLILTQWGERPIEALREGSMVVTRDHGLQPVRWIGRCVMRGSGDLAPIVITSAATGVHAPLTVSPRHRVLFTGYRAELLFGESEVLVAARHLVNGRDVCAMPQDKVTYIHLMFDRHEVIYASGIATESFHAGDAALSGITAAARDALFEVFPELRSAPGRHRDAARRCLLEHEAALLRQADDRHFERGDAPHPVSGAAQ